MYIDIIPSEHSIGIHPLTYSIPEDFEGEIIPGCIVEIPVRNSVEYGIVVGFRESSSDGMELRDIIRVVTNTEILAPYQLALILEISARYLIPIHRVLGFFLSKAVLKRLEKKNYEQISSIISSYPSEAVRGQLTILKDSIITGVILEQYMHA
jgi:primosomal protein N'